MSAGLVVTSAADLPRRYALVGQGNCMSPLAENGDQMVFDQLEPVKPGDLVVLWFREGQCPYPGTQAIYKRLVSVVPVELPFNAAPTSECIPLVTVEMLNPPRALHIRATALLAVHKCIGKADTNGDGTATLRQPEELAA